MVTITYAEPSETCEWYFSDGIACLLLFRQTMGTFSRGVPRFRGHLPTLVVPFYKHPHRYTQPLMSQQQPKLLRWTVLHTSIDNVKTGNHPLICHCTVMITIEHLISLSSNKKNLLLILKQLTFFSILNSIIFTFLDT